MKNLLIILFAASALALGTICIVQWNKLAGQQTQIDSLRSEAEQREQEIADLQAAQKFDERQRQDLFQQANALAKKVLAQQQAAAKVAAKSSGAGAATAESQKPNKEKAGFGGMLAKMMEDPETKKLIRTQQRAMLDQLYGPLVKQMGLQPEEADRFKDLLADQMMKGTENASSLLGGDSLTNRTQALSRLADEQKSYDEQLKGLLGESRYAQYKDYQQTVGERTLLNQFRQQYAGGESPISEPQTDQLLAFMREEKQIVAAAGNLPLPGETQDAASLQAMLSGEGVEKIFQNQETVNQRVYERARTVLSENQLAAFGAFQTNQLHMMRVSMNMMRKFMGPEESETGRTSPDP